MNLANLPLLTNNVRNGLQWSKPAFDGGSSVIDYRLWSDQGSNGATFAQIASGITRTLFIVNDLTQGVTY